MRRSKADALAAPSLAAGSSQSLDQLEEHVSGDTAVVTGVNYYSPAPRRRADQIYIYRHLCKTA